MFRRIKAMLMLLVVGLVLPAAGSAHLFCKLGCPEFGTPGGCVEAESDCCATEPGTAEEPDCLAVLKVLPEALQPESPSTCVAPMAGPLPLELVAGQPTGLLKQHLAGPRDREPPGGPPLYLMKRALLL